VFQLPAVSYPEAGRVHDMPDYAHLACHSYSRTLRWSYGTNRNRRWAEWHRYVAGLPPEDMIRALRTAGFAAVYVDRRGYDGLDWIKLFAALSDRLGDPVVGRFIDDRALFRLAEVGEAGDRDRLLNRPFVLFQRGFLPWVADGPRRALFEAQARLVNPDDRVRRVRLSMDWVRRGPADLTVRVSGAGVDRPEKVTSGLRSVRFDFDLPPGEHVLRFDVTQPPPWPARFYVAWEATDVRLSVLDEGAP